MAPESQITADRGDTNVYNLDATVPLVSASDQIWFTCKRSKADTDEDAVIALGLNVPGLEGIVVTDEATGKFQVQVPPDATAELEDQALLYDCQLKRAADDGFFTVRSGTMLLTGQVTKAS